MTFVVNKVVLAGRISDYGVKLSYLASGKPELTFTLVLERPVGEKTYRTFVPIQVYGHATEHLAETLEPGDLVLIDGTLSWKADRATQQGKPEKKPAASLAVSTFTVEVLLPAGVALSTPAPAPVDR